MKASCLAQCLARADVQKHGFIYFFDLWILPFHPSPPSDPPAVPTHFPLTFSCSLGSSYQNVSIWFCGIVLFIFPFNQKWVKGGFSDRSEPQESSHRKSISKKAGNWPTGVTCWLLASLRGGRGCGKKTDCRAGSLGFRSQLCLWVAVWLNQSLSLSGPYFPQLTIRGRPEEVLIL